MQKEYLLDEIIKVQTDDGYIGMLKKDARMWKLWDVHEMGYIIFGLVNDYKYFNKQQSLNLAIIGLDRAFLALYSNTKDPQYLNFLINRLHIPDWDMDIVLGRKKLVEGHSYAYLTRCLAQLELYGVQPDEQLLEPAMRAIKFLTEQNGMLVTGEVGQWECWSDDQDGGHALGETCSTAYQLRLYETLFRMKGVAGYGDLMERTIYNALFAAQSPNGRKIRYYTPIEGKREYYESDTYCCPNNYRRIISELPSMIYYQYNNGIAVNLYTSSEAKISITNGSSISVKQETDYPGSGLVKIIVSSTTPASFPICLRIPSWAKGTTICINDDAPLSVESGAMFKIERNWSGNDTITMNMPMVWRFVKGRQRQAGRVAVLRGPVVYCLNPGLNRGIGVEKMDSYSLGRIIIDPKSIKGLFHDETISDNGTTCIISAWKEGHGLGGKYDFELTLSEFTDPEGKASYFSIRDFSQGVDDELLKGIY